MTAPNCAHLRLPFREQSWFSPCNDPGGYQSTSCLQTWQALIAGC